MSRPARRNLVLTLDAFGTLFGLRASIGEQYAAMARLYSLPVNAELIEDSFHQAYRKQLQAHPNYGRASRMHYVEWWTTVIRDTFKPHISIRLPAPLLAHLIDRFSCDHGYRRHEDVMRLFQMIRNRKHDLRPVEPWPWERTVCGIVSNSDDRVTTILSSLGVTLGSSRGYRLGGSQTDETHDDCDISFVTLSYDVGVEKPDPQIFVAAKEYLESTWLPEKRRRSPGKHVPSMDEYEFLHVGDDLHKDVLAAREAGWHSVWLDRQQRFAAEFQKQRPILHVPLGDIPQDASSAAGASAVAPSSAPLRASSPATRISVIQRLFNLKWWKPGE